MIDYGVSASLQAEFEMLRETQSIGLQEDCASKQYNSIKKYSAKTIDKLAQYILCRNYGKACLELAYLCWPIVRHQEYSKGLLDFFWIDEAISPRNFRERMQGLAQAELSAPSVSMNEIGLVLSTGPQSFVISATRVSLLSALLELMVSNISGVLEDIEAHLSSPDSKCVKQLASHLQKKLYAYLKDHLPTANIQQKYRYIHQWVNNNAHLRKLNDDDVLNFWVSAIDEEGYVKFETALVDIVDYQFAEEQVKVGRELSTSLVDFDDRGIDSTESTWLYESVFELSANEITPPIWLTEQPKFLNKKEYAVVSLVYDLGSGALQFPMSHLRVEVFGQWQNLIIQQIRNKTLKVVDKPTLDYELYLQNLEVWRKNVVNTLLACASILYEGKNVQCISVLANALEYALETPESDAFQQMLKRLIEAGGSDKTDATIQFSDIRRWVLQSQTLNGFFTLAKKALAKNNRVGFKDANDYLEPALYEEGAQEMARALDMMKQITKAIKLKLDSDTTEEVSLHSIFDADLFIFKSELVKRHGLKYE